MGWASGLLELSRAKCRNSDVHASANADQAKQCFNVDNEFGGGVTIISKWPHREARKNDRCLQGRYAVVGNRSNRSRF
jgi:hypothetical protein